MSQPVQADVADLVPIRCGGPSAVRTRTADKAGFELSLRAGAPADVRHPGISGISSAAIDRIFGRAADETAAPAMGQ